MYSTILSGFLGIVGTLLGTALGWLLNSLSLRPRLCCVLNAPQNNDELISEGLRNKYSDSGYVIEIFNLGSTPVAVNTLGIYYKKNTLADGLNINKIIKPYETVLYELDEQTLDSIQYHCQKSDIKKCDVIIYDVAGKKIKSKLDIEWLKFKTLDKSISSFE